jgi:hypothetical protein
MIEVQEGIEEDNKEFNINELFIYNYNKKYRINWGEILNK